MLQCVKLKETPGNHRFRGHQGASGLPALPRSAVLGRHPSCGCPAPSRPPSKKLPPTPPASATSYFCAPVMCAGSAPGSIASCRSGFEYCAPSKPSCAKRWIARALSKFYSPRCSRLTTSVKRDAGTSSETIYCASRIARAATTTSAPPTKRSSPTWLVGSSTAIAICRRICIRFRRSSATSLGPEGACCAVASSR